MPKSTKRTSPGSKKYTTTLIIDEDLRRNGGVAAEYLGMRFAAFVRDAIREKIERTGKHMKATAAVLDGAIK